MPRRNSTIFFRKKINTFCPEKKKFYIFSALKNFLPPHKNSIIFASKKYQQYFTLKKIRLYFAPKKIWQFFAQRKNQQFFAPKIIQQFLPRKHSTIFCTKKFRIFLTPKKDCRQFLAPKKKKKSTIFCLEKIQKNFSENKLTNYWIYNSSFWMLHPL